MLYWYPKYKNYLTLLYFTRCLMCGYRTGQIGCERCGFLQMMCDHILRLKRRYEIGFSKILN